MPDRSAVTPVLSLPTIVAETAGLSQGPGQGRRGSTTLNSKRHATSCWSGLCAATFMAGPRRTSDWRATGITNWQYICVLSGLVSTMSPAFQSEVAEVTWRPRHARLYFAMELSSSSTYIPCCALVPNNIPEPACYETSYSTLGYLQCQSACVYGVPGTQRVSTVCRPPHWQPVAWQDVNIGSI